MTEQMARTARPGARPEGLAAHEARVARDLELLTLPPANWTAAVTGPDGQPLLDVLVVGAGMYGIAAAAALSFKGLRNLLVVDRAPEGQEGPWVTYARMETLRSPKQLPGVSLGIPSLTFRAWYEAREGQEAWESLYKVPNAVWQDYLGWVRRVLRLPVRNGVELLSATPGEGFVTVRLREGGEERSLHTRRLVLASGRGGTGGVSLPAGVDPALGPDRMAHTNAGIDFAALRGRHVAVIGAGPSSWDNASTALEAGAARVDMYVRRRVLPQINKGRGSAHPGFFEGWADLPPEEKWRILAYMHDLQAPPPHESIHRAMRHPNFRIHLGTPLRAARPAPEGVALDLGDGSHALVDFLILGTGFTVDMSRVTELSQVAGEIAIWADSYTPPPGLEQEELSRFPWLGHGFELTERRPGHCPGLSRIHLFNHAALASLGAVASDVPGVSTGAERLAHRMAAHFFTEDIGHVRERLEAFAEPELQGTPFFALPG
ncbi:FAD-dependent oxidoreductase [Roseomonas marmotae]|uniref:NAD(P)/FAD-dependent oxidoreductase n=1 Tax=Roseomonas marmotae TaxID=2768161 RepID=A0ABS3K7G0_9PROT|nr:NAD(P)/FAD-dependent oxidoreductase [Roseomonas marmotae]MBO1073406.1 NAD(P)/FAD-dependent oxidoreductase [Roseomonas marmotae]QTI80396.1 NAD(P)/FAD-dependent oxidoreductase [Roseomonas marmotae]